VYVYVFLTLWCSRLFHWVCPLKSYSRRLFTPQGSTSLFSQVHRCSKHHFFPCPTLIPLFGHQVQNSSTLFNRPQCNHALHKHHNQLFDRHSCLIFSCLSDGWKSPYPASLGLRLAHQRLFKTTQVIRHANCLMLWIQSTAM
jgi:hypothetical protein